MVGTQSKLGNRYPVTAFETGERVTVEYLNDFLMDDSKAAPVPIEFEPMAENMDGYFSSDQQRIAIREGMSEVQTVSAAVHETCLLYTSCG